MPGSDVTASLHVEHNKRVFSFYLFITQVIMPKLSYCFYVQKFMCRTGNTSTGFEGTTTYSIIRSTFKCEMTVRKLHYPYVNTASPSNQNICPSNIHIHARLTNQAAQNAYYDFNKRAPTTALSRAR